MTLACVSNDDCPEDYFCETRLDPSECRLLEERDLTLPGLGEADIDLALARAGQTLTATFETTKPVVPEKIRVFVGNDVAERQFVEDEAA